MSENFAFRQLLELCRRTHEEMQARASRTVDLALVVRNWLFGWYIVEFEQHGADRAEYGAQLIERLALDLRIKGTSATNLRKFRQFYREFPIQQTLSVESGTEISASTNWQTVSVERGQYLCFAISALSALQGGVEVAVGEDRSRTFGRA